MTRNSNARLPQTEAAVGKFKTDYAELILEEVAAIWDIRPRTVLNWAAMFQAHKKPKNTKNQSWHPDVFPNEEGEILSFSQVMKVAIDMQKLCEKEGNIPSEVEIAIPTNQPIAVTFIADLHIGDRGTDNEALYADMKFLKDTPRLYAIFGGDIINNAIFGLKQSSMDMVLRQTLTISLQWRAYEGLVNELKDKILCMSTGTHEDWSMAVTGVDWVQKLAARQGIIYTGHGGLIKLKVGEIEYRIFRRHHYPYHTSFNPLHSVKRMWDMGPHDFDIGVLEQRHRAAIETFDRHGEERIALRCGSYKVYDEYARKLGYYGMRPANPTVILWHNEKRMLPFLHHMDAVEALRGL